MATITAVTTETGNGRTHHSIWETMGNADTGTAISLPGAVDRCVHMTGTVGGATVTVQGSNDLLAPTNWATLHDASSTALALTAVGVIEQILENPLHIRVITSGGTGTDVDVQIVSRSTRNG